MRYIFIFFFFFLGHGTYFSALSPYINSCFGERASVIFLAGQILFPVGYFLAGYLSDRLRRLRLLLVVGLVIHAPVQWLLFSFPEPEGYTTTLLLSGLTRFLFAVNFQLVTIAVLEGVGTASFGSTRMYGTLSFFLIHLFFFLSEGGYFTNLGLGPTGLAFDRGGDGAEAAALSGRVGALFHIVTALFALGIQKDRLSRVEYYFRDAVRIFVQPPVLFVVFLSFVFYFSYQLVDYYLGQYFNRSLGMRWVYAAWCLAVLLEIPFLPLSARIARGVSIRALFMVSALVGAIRFAWLAAHAAGLLEAPILYSQLLHGIHFSGYYMGAVYWLRTGFPDHLFGTANGLYMILAPALGGMTGNLAFGAFLYSDLARSLAPAGGGPMGVYYSLFFSAALLQIGIFFCFIFAASPRKRIP